MNLHKWWLTHGPGSPGAVAKTVAKAYNKCKIQHPNASKSELLRMTLADRMRAAVAADYPALDKAKQEEIIKKSEGKLSFLILEIIHFENPHAIDAMFEAPEVYREMFNVIVEITEKYASGA